MESNFLEYILRGFMKNLMQYAFIAGSVFLLLYMLLKNLFLPLKIQPKFPRSKDIYREIWYSILTVFIFMGMSILVFKSPISQYNLRYTEINEFGRWYWILSIFLMVLLHDAYFYWTHRMMHHPKLFKYFHLVHHKSTNPSPWSAYAFHPLEAVVEAGILIPISFLIPFHASALSIFIVVMIVYNVYGHSGYEIWPYSFHKNFLGQWINTSFNHNQHHEHFTGNYGLYFLFWDRMMGTLRKDNDSKYMEFTKRLKRNPSYREKTKGS